MSDYPASLPAIPSGFVDGDDSGDETPGSAAVGAHAGHHNQLAEELLAALAELGTTPSGAAATVAARFAALDTAVADSALDSDLTAHAVAKTGVHGIPAMTAGHGLLWDGADWQDTDLATQTELATHAALSGASGHVPAGGIANADVAAAAAIAKSKLAALAVVNADVDGAAAIAESKLALASDAAAGTASRRTLGFGAAQAAQGSLTDEAFTLWKMHQQASRLGILNSTHGTAIELLYYGGVLAVGGNNSATCAFVIDPSRHDATGRTEKLVLGGALACNGTLPGTTITLALAPVATWGGVNTTENTKIAALSADSASVNWVAGDFTVNVLTAIKRSEITFPAAGAYVLYVKATGTIAANSSVTVIPWLEWRQV